MSGAPIVDQQVMRTVVERIVQDTPVTDIHTHLYAPAFGDMLLSGIDELLTYHYLVAEAFRWLEMPYDVFWAMPKQQQADLIWQTLFLDRSPVSEACRGVVTTLQRLGLDMSDRNLNAVRATWDALQRAERIDRVFTTAGVESVIMTNDPFDANESEIWRNGPSHDLRFRTALRLDTLLNDWSAACRQLQMHGYQVAPVLDAAGLEEIRRFLRAWITCMQALYLAVSLPPTFTFPDESDRGVLLRECVLPVCQEFNRPLALMSGVQRGVNPALHMAGDGLGHVDLATLTALCQEHPHNKFLVTLLAREDQYALCVLARKFRNLLPFGCWWFLNTPAQIKATTRMRLELLGLSFIPQHSDARVLEQLVYKWTHARTVIADVLTQHYGNLFAAGWPMTEDDIQRDVAGLFGGNFWCYLDARV